MVELRPTTSAAASPEAKPQCLQELSQTGQDLMNNSQVSYILFLLPTQDQTEKAQYG